MSRLTPVLLVVVGIGCADDFNPGELNYACDSAADCLPGYECVFSAKYGRDVCGLPSAADVVEDVWTSDVPPADVDEPPDTLDVADLPDVADAIEDVPPPPDIPDTPDTPDIPAVPDAGPLPVDCSTSPDGTPCDNGDPCTVLDVCGDGECKAGDFVCGDQPLSVSGTAANAPTILALGDGRYAAQWIGDSNALGDVEANYELPANRLRVTDAAGSRSDRETALIGGAKNWTPAPLTLTDGVLAALEVTGTSYKCNYSVGTTTCNYGGALRAAVFGESPSSTELLPLSGSISCHVGCDDHLPVLGTASLSFAGGARGVLVRFDMHYGVASVPEGPTYDPPVKRLEYFPATADLTPGAPKKLLATNQLPDPGRFHAQALADGTDRFMLVWVDATGSALRGARYLANGAADSGEPWLLGNTVDATVGAVRVAPLKDGTFLVAWDQFTDDAPSNILLARYYPSGDPVAAPKAVAAGAGDERLGGLGVLSDGRYLLVYDDSQGDLIGWGVKALLFGADGKVDKTIAVNHTVAGDQQAPSVAVLDDDQWVVSFIDDAGLAWTRRFDSDGEAVAGRPEVRLAEETEGDQVSGSAAGSGDKAMVVYASAVPGKAEPDVFMRLVSPDGAPVTVEAPVNTTTVGAQTDPAVAFGGDLFIAVWESFGQDGDISGIAGRRFGPDGAPQGVDFVVNTTTAGYQRQPTVAAMDSGRHLVAWSGVSAVSKSESDIYGRLFAGDGTEFAAEFVVNKNTVGPQARPAAAAGAEAFYLAWETNDLAGAGPQVRVGRVAKEGGVVQVAATANVVGAGYQQRPDIALDGANVLVCWESDSQPEGSGWDIVCVVSDASTLTPLAGEFLPHGFAPGDDRNVSTAAHAAGGYVLVWEAGGEAVDGSGTAIHYQRLSTLGQPIGRPVVANRTWSGNQGRPFVVVGSHAVLGWESDQQDGDGLGLYVRGGL